MVKMDLANAYRIVPVHPEDQPLLGICLQGNTYLDRALPFGLRSAPKIFNAVADFIAWVLHCEGIPFLIHYLDDFLFFDPPGSHTTATVRPLAEWLFNCMGAPIAQHKTEGPTTSLTFLGIVIDTNLFQLRLPQEKVDRLKDMLLRWRSRKACTKKELESLLGHLSHAATVIRPGRIFLRNLFALLSRVSNPQHFIRLNMQSRTDLLWWGLVLIQHWNGFSFFPSPTPAHQVFSDASGSFGCGAIIAGISSWFQLKWPTAWEDTGITAKELVPIVVAAALWGRSWGGKHIHFVSDNEAVVAIIMRRNAKLPLLTQLLRCLFFYASVYNFHFSASHIPGVDNHAADAISRNNLSLLSSLLPQATRVIVPQPVVDFLLFLPDWGSSIWIQRFAHSLQVACHHPPAVATALGFAAT